MTQMAKRRLGSRLKPRVSPRTVFPQGRVTGGRVQSQRAAAQTTSGGGQPRTKAGTVAFELSPWAPTARDPFDFKKAAHLMRRAGFGAKPDEIEVLVMLGPHRTIDLLTIPSRWGLQEFGSQMLPTGEVLNLHNSVVHQRAQWVHEAATTHFPLKEKMALFWHDHFSVGANNATAFPMQIPHVNIFRRHGLGKFRDILVEVSRDPAMLYWLDNRINGARGRVNENYGRELLELYTMGVNGGYTQKDVVEASRCLAGWSLFPFNQFRYIASYARAGAGRKTVLGTQIYVPANQQQEGFRLIDLLLRQKATSEFLVAKIWSYFVSERPTSDPVEQKLWDDIVVELARRWKSVGYDIRGLMWTILSSNYFFSARAMRKLVKNPMEYLVGSIRNLRTPFIGRHLLLGNYVEAMGLALFRYTNPSGLDDGVAWIDSQSLINRSTYADDLTQVSTTANFRVRWNPMDEVRRKNLFTKKAIVDHFIKILVDDEVPAAVRQNLSTYMDYYDGTPNRVFRPYDNLPPNSQYRITKIRGLVQLIMILPEYSVN